MTYSLRMAIIGLLGMFSVARAVTVDGYAHLRGQSDHSNIKVLFDAASPTAITDSVYTDDAGYFAVVLQAGIYDVVYSFTGYATYRLNSQTLVYATTLPLLTLLPPLSGSLSGSLGPGEWQVEDTLTVDSAHTLTIQPGTRLYFAGRYPLTVRGRLRALANAQDSILFTHRYSPRDSLWRGIRFERADTSCRMEYCAVEYSGYTLPFSGPVVSGVGISCRLSRLVLNHCVLRNNSSDRLGYGSGGGMGCELSNVTLNNCLIAGNYAGQDGAGIYAAGSTLTLTQCTLRADTSNGSGGGLCSHNSVITITGGLFERNLAAGNGGAICSEDSTHLTMVNALVQTNASDNNGAGMWISGEHSDVQLTGCVIRDNLAYNNSASAIAIENANPRITRCTIFGGRAVHDPHIWGRVPAISCSQGNMVLTSSIVADNTVGSAIRFALSSGATVAYNDFFANDTTFDGTPLVGIGVLALTNARGDSCDSYYNIYLNPQFVDTAAADYHLRALSACIDAGDPGLSHDPDSTVADMGAYYYPHTVQADEPFILRPLSFSLSCYPNPFNAITRIAFDLPRAERVRLSIYDVTGRLAATVISADLPAGSHEVTFDGTNLTSGLYFYRLQTKDFAQTKKMVLLK